MVADSVEFLTQKELVKRLGVTARQVRNLHGHGIPRADSGLYPWPAANKWYIKFKQEEKLERSGARAAVSEFETAKAKNMTARARTAELEVARLEGSLIPIDVHEQRVTLLVEHWNGTLKSIRGRWAHELLGMDTVQEAQVRLGRLVNELVAELAAFEVPVPTPNANGRSAA